MDDKKELEKTVTEEAAKEQPAKTVEEEKVALPSDFSQIKMDVDKLTSEEKAKLDEAQQAVAKRSGKNRRAWNIGMFFLNVGVIAGILLYTIFTKEFTPLSQIDVNIEWFLVAFLLYGVAFLFDTWSVAYLLKKNCGKYRFGLSMKATMCGRYYDAVTPLATGGQPFQMTYLSSHDVPSAAALSVPMARMFFQQLTWLILSAICLIIAYVDQSFNMLVSIASIIGFVLAFLMMSVTLFLSISKKTGKVLVVKTLKLLQKMKIVKNYEKQYQRVAKYVEDYQNIMTNYVKSPKDFFVMTISCFLRDVVIYVIPFFVYCMFSEFDPSMFIKMSAMGVIIDLASSYTPLPGGSGAMELSFSAMFATYFNGGELFWALIVWRFFSYYSYLVFGFAMIAYDFFYGNRKYKWQKVEQRLQLESKQFKDAQIANFRSQRAYRRKRQLRKTLE